MFLRLRPNSKVPDVAKGESIDSASSADPAEIERWSKDGYAVGERLRDKVVADFDEKDAAREFWRTHAEFCTHAVETFRGLHLHFAGTTSLRKFRNGDVKHGPNAYVVIPPSMVRNNAGVLWQYRWVRQEGPLLPFPEHLFEGTQGLARAATVKKVTDIDAYLSKIESVQGNGGSHGLVRAAARCRDFGLTEAEAMAKLIVWNQNEQLVSPPWSLDELARAVSRTYAKGKS